MIAPTIVEPKPTSSASVNEGTTILDEEVILATPETFKLPALRVLSTVSVDMVEAVPVAMMLLNVEIPLAFDKLEPTITLGRLILPTVTAPVIVTFESKCAEPVNVEPPPT